MPRGIPSKATIDNRQQERREQDNQNHYHERLNHRFNALVQHILEVTHPPERGTLPVVLTFTKDHKDFWNWLQAYEWEYELPPHLDNECSYESGTLFNLPEVARELRISGKRLLSIFRQFKKAGWISYKVITETPKETIYLIQTKGVDEIMGMCQITVAEPKAITLDFVQNTLEDFHQDMRPASWDSEHHRDKMDGAWNKLFPTLQSDIADHQSTSSPAIH
ncbi:TPA: hypothetical protein SLF71_003696 [Klebsiella aerogenes]|nr:hypothetical protein [Klebsiella aerogenes]